MKVGVIGGGAAGFFAAISAAEHHPNAKIIVFEKSPKLLSKVKISGGGRCNVTNGCTDIKELSKAYPRGGNNLKKAFGTFSTKETMEWFEKRGVPLVTQEDGCVFPKSQDSQSIIDCFLKEANKYGIRISTSMGIKGIERLENEQLVLHFIKSIHAPQTFDKVIVATGGSPKLTGLQWLEKLGHKIDSPVPSLFTFNMPSESVTELMGVVVEKTLTNIQGTKLKSDGPLLITHWGMSGPSILKLSAFGARILQERQYKCILQVNWVNEINIEIVKEKLHEIIQSYAGKNLGNIRPYYLPERLWHFLLKKCDISQETKWQQLSKKAINKITAILTNDTYQVSGKTTFKEEFVTCGGVSLKSINFKTMQSKACPNVYLAGEVTDVDGITGGYNFQSCWTTGYIAGKLL
jgi:predicted Rossmann fold flavoprotein